MAWLTFNLQICIPPKNKTWLPHWTASALIFTSLLCQTLRLIILLLKGYRQCPLPTAEESARKHPFTLCVRAAAASVVHLARCPGQVWSPRFHCLVPFNSFLTDLATAGFKNPANRMSIAGQPEPIVVVLWFAHPLMRSKNRKGDVFHSAVETGPRPLCQQIFLVKLRGWFYSLKYRITQFITGSSCCIDQEGSEADWTTSRLMCSYDGGISLRLMDSSVSD